MMIQTCQTFTPPSGLIFAIFFIQLYVTPLYILRSNLLNPDYWKFTFTKWEQAASTAVGDHELPSVFFTINFDHLGISPSIATIELTNEDRKPDL